MANIYPSPTLYSYRVSQQLPPNPSRGSGSIKQGTIQPVGNPTQPGPTNAFTPYYPGITAVQGWFLTEYSTNGGTTWALTGDGPFQDAQSAFTCISNIVSNEAQFAANLPPATTHVSYPI